MRPRPGYDFCEYLPPFLEPVQKQDMRNQVFNFGIGDIRAVPGYDEVLQQTAQEVLSQVAAYLVRLPGQQGFGPLCDELARIHSSISGRELQRSTVLLTEGGCSAISVALAAVLEPRRKVAYAVPSFPYWCILDSAGFDSMAIPFDTPEEYAATYGERLREILKSDSSIKAVILNEPQNPMGCPLEESQLQLIGQLAEEHDLQVIVDDVAIPFAFRAGEWPARYIGQSRCFIVGSFTKQFAVPGLRLGWLIAPPSKIAAARSVVANLRAGVCNLAAVFGYQLLRHLTCQSGKVSISAEVKRRVEETAVLAEQPCPGVHFWVPGQGLYLLGRLTNTHFQSATEFVAALRQQGLYLMDYTFLFPPHLRDGYAKRLFRFSVGGEPSVRAGIAHLVLAIQAYLR